MSGTTDGILSSLHATPSRIASNWMTGSFPEAEEAEDEAEAHSQDMILLPESKDSFLTSDDGANFTLPTLVKAVQNIVEKER
jgi:hypothetical protein